MSHAPRPGGAGRFRRALVVAHHPLYAEALRLELAAACPGCRSVTARDMGGALAALHGGPAPDLLLYDLDLPGGDGMAGLRRLAGAAAAPVLVVSEGAAGDLVEALVAAGAAGVVPKRAPSETLGRAVRAVGAGRVFLPEAGGGRGAARAAAEDRAAARTRLAALTPRQGRILEMIRDGMSNREIARHLSLAEASVKGHVTALLRRLGVQNRTQAALLARLAGPEDGAAPGEAAE